MGLEELVKELERINSSIDGKLRELEELYMKKLEIVVRALKAAVPNLRAVRVYIDTSDIDASSSEELVVDSENIDFFSARDRFGEDVAKLINEFSNTCWELYWRIMLPSNDIDDVEMEVEGVRAECRYE